MIVPMSQMMAAGQSSGISYADTRRLPLRVQSFQDQRDTR
jgi:hypothetical protein